MLHSLVDSAIQIESGAYANIYLQTFVNHKVNTYFCLAKLKLFAL